MGLTTSKESFQSVDCTSAVTQNAMRTAIQAQLGSGVVVTDLQAQAMGDGRCLAVYNKRAATTGLITKGQRVVSFSATGTVTPGPEIANVQNLPLEVVTGYYDRLRAYNNTWNRTGWRAIYTASALAGAGTLYDPPRPPWTDTLFERNIALYNDNLRAVGRAGGVFDAATAGSLSASIFRDNFKRYIAPTPAEPVPPAYKSVIDPPPPVVLPPDVKEQLDRDRGAADNNTTAISQNQRLYDSLIPPGDPLYDPPLITDDYETVLIKINTAYDIAAGRRSASVPMSGSTPSPYDRRLRGRVAGMPALEAPAAVMGVAVEGYANGTATYGFVPFTERQKYLIEYSPVADKTALQDNMCKSRGYLPFNTALANSATPVDGIPMTAENGCFVEYPAAPAYMAGSAGSTASGSQPTVRPRPFDAVPPYNPPYRSPLNAMCPSGSCGPPPVPVPLPGSASTAPAPKRCPQTTIKGKTVHVPSRPKNTETSRKILTYRMGTPAGDCPIVGTMTADGQMRPGTMPFN